MRLTRALMLGLLALATAACATGPVGTGGGLASPGRAGDEIPRCDAGTYNRAAGFCVTGGP